MTQAEENQQQAIGYLFGELGDEERDRVEDRLFADDDFSLFLSAVEKDLVDDYVRGEMDAALRRRFERRYLTTDSRREKIRLAGVLQSEVFAEKLGEPEIIAPAAAPKPSVWSSLADFFRAPNLALAGGLAVILLFLLAGGWILLRRAPNSPEIVRDDNANRLILAPSETPEKMLAPEKTPANENTGGKLSNTENSNAAPTPETNTNQTPAIENKSPDNKSPESKSPDKPRPTPAPRPTEKREQVPPRTIFATLFPILRSGDEKPTLTVPPNAGSVRLRLVHDNLEIFARYRIEVRDQNGDLILTREVPFRRKNPSRPLDLNIPAAALGAGTYELLLSGVRADDRTEVIKNYNFSIKKK